MAYELLYGDGPDEWTRWHAPSLSVRNFLHGEGRDWKEYVGDLASHCLSWYQLEGEEIEWDAIGAALLFVWLDGDSTIDELHAEALAEERWRNMSEEERATAIEGKVGEAIDALSQVIPKIWG